MVMASCEIAVYECMAVGTKAPVMEASYSLTNCYYINFLLHLALG